MGTVSKAPAVLAALLSIVDAATSVPVYDGPFVTGDPSDAIHIGYDGDPETETEAVTSGQRYKGAASKSRDEDLTIVNAIYLVNGAAETAVARARGYELLGIVETAITADPSLGLPPPCKAGVDSHSLVLVPTQAGVELWLRFWVVVNTRL